MLLVIAALSGCGGSSAGGPGAKGAEGEGGGETGAQAGETGSAEESVDLRAAACADGTCVPCGAGICPNGFYCDEKAPGGAGCAWLPECADRATCSCVQQVLGSSCSCDERNGGVFVGCE